MLKAVRGKWRDQAALQRSLHRYYLACCRGIWPLLLHPASRHGVEVGERYLDGWASKEELSKADWDVEHAAYYLESDLDPDVQVDWARAVGALTPAELRAMLHDENGPALAPDELLRRAAYFTSHVVTYRHHRYARLHERRYACFLSAGLLRCVFANPLRRPTMKPDWRSADVVGLALGIDADGAYDRLPLLADALMDAGCDDEHLLPHARADGHVRGCWLVDLVLGRE
jgi:hypothetical protein